MIGIYVSESIHSQIKMLARTRGQSIKEYILALHNSYVNEGHISPAEQPLALKIEKKLNTLISAISPLPPSKISEKQNPESYTRPPNTTDLMHEKFRTYLKKFERRPHQKKAIKETLQIIIDKGGTATSSEIKMLRGFSRTTMINRQIQRLIQDKIITKDGSLIPYSVTLRSPWKL